MQREFKQERAVDNVLKEFFPRLEFLQVRPTWLMGKKGYPLELDFYCEEIKLAIEVQGEQHYKPCFSKAFSVSVEELLSIQGRDCLKEEICAAKGVTLCKIIYNQGKSYEEVRKVLWKQLYWWIEQYGDKERVSASILDSVEIRSPVTWNNFSRHTLPDDILTVPTFCNTDKIEQQEKSFVTDKGADSSQEEQVISEDSVLQDCPKEHKLESNSTENAILKHLVSLTEGVEKLNSTISDEIARRSHLPTIAAIKSFMCVFDKIAARSVGYELSPEPHQRIKVSEKCSYNQDIYTLFIQERLIIMPELRETPNKGVKMSDLNDAFKRWMYERGEYNVKSSLTTFGKKTSAYLPRATSNGTYGLCRLKDE